MLESKRFAKELKEISTVYIYCSGLNSIFLVGLMFALVHFIGVHALIFFLNSFKSLLALISRGTIVFHTIGPKSLNERYPLVTVFTLGHQNSAFDLVRLCIGGNSSLTKCGHKSCFILKHNSGLNRLV